MLWGQVGVVDRARRERGVAVDEVVLLPRAGGEGVDDLAGVDAFPGPGHEAGLDELDHAVDEHLGVDAEVADARVLQEPADGVRHAADPDLETGAVAHLGGDQRRDLAVDVGGARVADLRDGVVAAVDHVVDLARVHGLFRAEDVRQRRRGLDDQDLRALGHRLVVADGAVEVEPAVRVHRAGPDADDVDRIDEAAVVVGCLAEVHRHVVGASFVGAGAVVAGEVPVVPEEVRRRTGRPRSPRAAAC